MVRNKNQICTYFCAKRKYVVFHHPVRGIRFFFPAVLISLPKEYHNVSIIIMDLFRRL